MINQTVEFDEITAEVVTTRLREYFAAELDGVDLTRVAEALLVFLALDPDDGARLGSERALFIRGIGALVCAECGKASCLCGYPDC